MKTTTNTNTNNTTARPASESINAFTAASTLERLKLTQVYNQTNVTDFWFTPEDGHDRYEGEFTKNGKTYIVEAKNRANTSTKYPTTLIEASKVNFLRTKAAAENKIPLLIIFFTDNQFGIYNLNNIQESWRSTKYCNRTTAASTGKVNKDVYLIPITFESLRELQY